MPCITHAMHHPCHAHHSCHCSSSMPFPTTQCHCSSPMSLLITHAIAHHPCHFPPPMPFPTTHVIAHHSCHCPSPIPSLPMPLPITHAIARRGSRGGGGRTPTFICTNFFKKSPKLAKKILGASTPNPLRPLLFQITDPPLIAHHQCHCLSPRF